MQTATFSRQRGLSLIEVTIALAITALSVGMAAPSFERMTQRRHIDGTAAQLETDFHYMRSLVVARNQSLRMSFSANAAMTCYVVHTGGAGDCSCNDLGHAVCRAGAQALRTVPFAAGGPVMVRSNSASMLVDPLRGTVSPTGTMRVQGRNGETMQLVVNIMGRVRACAATPGLPGHPRC